MKRKSCSSIDAIAAAAAQQNPLRVLKFSRAAYMPHQWEFLTSDARECALVGGYGSGKTLIFIRRVLRHMINDHHDGGKPANGWAVYPTYDMGRELFLEPLSELLTTLLIKHVYAKSKYSITIPPFGTVKIKSMQNPEKLIGSNLTFVGFDEFDVEREVICDMVWKRALGRLRGCKHPHLFIVTTPEGYRMTYKLFVEDNLDGRRHLIRAKTTDNPHLPREFIDNLKASYDKKLIAQYMNGEFVNLVGERAYYAFDRNVHVIDGGDIPGNEIVVGMDFNVNPMTAVVLKRSGQAHHVVREYWLANSNTARMCEVINSDYPAHDVTVCPDMTGIGRATSSDIGVTDIQIIKRAGFRVQGRDNPKVRDRLNTVNNALEKRFVTIHSCCKHLINDLEKVVRDDNNELDKSDPRLTHVSDALGYALSILYPIHQQRWQI